MKLFYKIFLAALVGVACPGCGDYLDVTPENVGTLDYAFRNRNEAENYLFSCYAYLQRGSENVRDAGFTTSSEIIYPNNLTQHPIDETGFNLIRGTQNVGSPGLNSWDGENGSYSLFRSIRVCNTMLENIDKPIDLSAFEKKQWIAEVKFLKAYYHFNLLRKYGPIPIMRDNISISAEAEEVRVYREPVDSVVNYIVSQLDEAAADLPAAVQNPARDMGRVTSLIALAVKAEVLIYAASPIFNGNPDYAGVTDKRGVELFSTAYEVQKWQRAADAARQAIEACEAYNMGLYTFIPPANITKLTDTLRLEMSLRNAVTEKWDLNRELVWALNPIFEYQGYCTPRLTSKSTVNIFSNPSTFAVPLSTAELFYSENGVPIQEDKGWDYAGRHNPEVSTDDYRFYIDKGYETAKLNFRREPRFYASLAFDGSIWFGNGITDQTKLYSVRARGNTSFAGPKDRQRINVTGYWPKKLVHYQSVYDDGFQPIHFHLPVIRMAGLYLWYAEALNEVNGPSAEVYEYINRVRTRAGLASVEQAWSQHSRNATKHTTREGLRQIIHQERRIELCFEGQAGWDLRRWKEMQEVLSKPLQGWSIYQKDPVNYYRPQTVIIPIFGIKNYLWPIKANNLVINPNLVQNPYW